MPLQMEHSDSCNYHIAVQLGVGVEYPGKGTLAVGLDACRVCELATVSVEDGPPPS